MRNCAAPLATKWNLIRVGKSSVVTITRCHSTDGKPRLTIRVTRTDLHVTTLRPPPRRIIVAMTAPPTNRIWEQRDVCGDVCTPRLALIFFFQIKAYASTRVCRDGSGNLGVQEG
ncbi:hypothetical protein D4764_09G0003800 [Takifugu flavidus]|uniref:Uncharacterized protein n=1 Tax=Takifugu flavidus TaxID=433684 RepID=A0A5C6MMD4_9TELE|nr:hypothetical protein D4764_09G0003800 [Takifugu flavidus]